MDMQVAALDILTTKGGFAPAAARAIGEAMDLQIARSYEDLATNKRLDETCALTNKRLDETRVLLESKIDAFRMELKCDIAALEVEMEKLKSDIVRWMFAALVGQTAVMLGLMRLFMPHGP
jgi:hypothetical protein